MLRSKSFSYHSAYVSGCFKGNCYSRSPDDFDYSFSASFKKPTYAARLKGTTLFDLRFQILRHKEKDQKVTDLLVYEIMIILTQHRKISLNMWILLLLDIE